MQQPQNGADDRSGDGSDVTTILDADATIRYVSPSIEPILGYKPEQLVGQNWFHYVHPDDAAQALPGFGQSTQQDGVVQRNAVRVRHANGSWVDVEEIGSNLLHYPGVHGWILNARNVGPRHAAARGVIHAAQRDEIAAAIAQVASELVGVLTPTQVLERLCAATNDVVGCDCSHALLLDPQLDAFIPVAHCGATTEQWEALQRMRIPRAALLRWQSTRSTPEEHVTSTHPLASLQRQHGVTVSICSPLMRGAETVGYLHLGRRNPGAAFNDLERHVASRATHLASRALEAAQRCEALERNNRWRAQFVAALSHELRTPLNVITGYHDLLLDGTFGPLSSEQSYTLGRAHRSARELLDIITSTLDLGRLDAGRLRLSVQTIALNDLFDELARETAELCDKPGVSIEWNVSAELPKVATDPAKLKTIVKNLIANAIRLTDHGSIQISAQPHGKAVELTVTDTGAALSSEDHTVILDPASYTDPARFDRFGGSALGLYVVRRLIDLLEGTITVDAQAGIGTVFRVSIPLERGASAVKIPCD